MPGCSVTYQGKKSGLLKARGGCGVGKITGLLNIPKICLFVLRQRHCFFPTNVEPHHMSITNSLWIYPLTPSPLFFSLLQFCKKTKERETEADLAWDFPLGRTVGSGAAFTFHASFISTWDYMENLFKLKNKNKKSERKWEFLFLVKKFEVKVKYQKTSNIVCEAKQSTNRIRYNSFFRNRNNEIVIWN